MVIKMSGITSEFIPGMKANALLYRKSFVEFSLTI